MGKGLVWTFWQTRMAHTLSSHHSSISLWGPQRWWSGCSNETDLEKHRSEELLDWMSTVCSIRSGVISQLKDKVGCWTLEEDYDLFYLMRCIAILCHEGLHQYLIGSLFAICEFINCRLSAVLTCFCRQCCWPLVSSLVSPFAKQNWSNLSWHALAGPAISSFTMTTNSEHHCQGNRNALWLSLHIFLEIMLVLNLSQVFHPCHPVCFMYGFPPHQNPRSHRKRLRLPTVMPTN